MSGVTTHILDTVAGCPAAGVKIELYRLAANGDAQLVRAVKTNRDGRADKPILAPEETIIGTYELRFFIADYFAGGSAEVADPPFLDIVPIRFSIADPAAHYHVPLLVSPWSYTTYRGS
ncbi:MAG: hydroxyisourate hydrolase [Fimbriimonadaceae bacterium]|nr:hydroxyisourate hydrolase [Alphaproteobacteria bacterium]